MAQNGLEKSLHVVYDNKGQHMVGMIVYLKKYNFFLLFFLNQEIMAIITEYIIDIDMDAGVLLKTPYSLVLSISYEMRLVNLYILDDSSNIFKQCRKIMKKEETMLYYFCQILMSARLHQIATNRANNLITYLLTIIYYICAEEIFKQ